MSGTGARFIGQSVPRREDRRMLSGRGRYVADVKLPGMLHAAFVRSDVARGQIVRVDTAAARAVPGVAGVFTAEDFNSGVGPLWASMYSAAPHPPLRPLAATDVRFVGDAIAIVVAETRRLAEDAAAMVEVDIDPTVPLLDLTASVASSDLVHPELGTNVAGAVEAVDDAAWQQIVAEAAHVVTRRITQGRAANVPMETRGIVAHWDPWVPELRIWSSTQNAHEIRAAAARVLGLPEHSVRVVSGDVGGGFGMKIYLSTDEACVVLAAHRLAKPVQWIEDRRENLLAAGHARADEATVSLAVAADGQMLGIRAEHLEDVGAFPVGSISSSAGGIRRHLPGPYHIPHVSYRGAAVYTNTCGRIAYRGPWMFETTMREQIIDQAARVLGMDPIDLRRRNALCLADMPFTSAGGMRYDDITPAETLEMAADTVGYASFRERQAAALAQGRYLGVGIAMFAEPSGMGAGMLGTEQAIVRIEPSGAVNVYMGTGSTGNSLETTIPQVVAEHLGCNLDDVVFHQGDTDSSPWGHGSGGSRAAVQGGGAARAAAIDLNGRIRRIAADLLEAAPDDLVVEDAVVSVRGTPTRSVTIAAVAEAVYKRPEAMPTDVTRGLEAAVRFKPDLPYTFSNASHICTCEVDITTGQVTLLDYVVGEDCGVIINPMVVDGQIAGGVVQGIGGALLERMVYDTNGTPITTDLPRLSAANGIRRSHDPRRAPGNPVKEPRRLQRHGRRWRDCRTSRCCERDRRCARAPWRSTGRFARQPVRPLGTHRRHAGLVTSEHVRLCPT